MSLYTQKESNIRRTWILMVIFLVVIIGVGWVFAQIYGNSAILYVAVIFSLVMNFISYWYSDKIVLKISRAEKIEKKDAPELYNVLENLSITAGLPMPRLYLIDEPAMNAFATGRNPERAVVAVTRGLIEKLNRSEMEGVLAHELSHVGNRDILLSTVVVVLVGFVALLSDFFMRSLFWGRFGGRDRDSGRAGAILMLVGVVLAILAPIATTLIQLAVSRKREFLADTSGALLTRYPDGLASALQKISKDNTPLRVANKATNHLWVSEPRLRRGFGGQANKNKARSKSGSIWMTHSADRGTSQKAKGVENLMENLEQQLNRETGVDFLMKEFKKYKLEEISFEDLFAEINLLRKEALESGNPILLKMIEEVGEQMQEEEKNRMESKEGGEEAVL